MELPFRRSILSSALTLFCCSAFADPGWTFKPRISLGYSAYSIESKPFTYDRYNVDAVARTASGQSYSFDYVMPGATRRVRILTEQSADQQELFTIVTPSGDMLIPDRTQFQQGFDVIFSNNSGQLSASDPQYFFSGSVGYDLILEQIDSSDLPIEPKREYLSEGGFFLDGAINQSFDFWDLDENARALLGFEDGPNFDDFNAYGRVESLFESGAVEQNGILPSSALTGGSKETFSKQEDGLVEINTPVLSLGAQLSSKNIFIDFYYEELYKETDGSDGCLKWDSEARGHLPCSANAATGILLHTGVDTERWEYGFSLGYEFENNLALILGYRESKTELSQSFVDPVSSNGRVDKQTLQESAFEQKGPFVSISYRLDVLKGKVKFDLSYSQPDASHHTSETLSFDNILEYQTALDFGGDADSYSFGMEYSAAIGTSDCWEWAVGGSYRITQFDLQGTASEMFRWLGNSASIGLNTVSAVKKYTRGEIEEEILSANVSLKYNFDF